jgi:preprotein translocase subunit SecE
MSVSNEVTQGVTNPTRKQAWSAVGIVLLSVGTSLLTPVVVKQIRKLTGGKK